VSRDVVVVSCDRAAEAGMRNSSTSKIFIIEEYVVENKNAVLRAKKTARIFSVFLRWHDPDQVSRVFLSLPTIRETPLTATRKYRRMNEGMQVDFP
jgi:hypothetical protein